MGGDSIEAVSANIRSDPDFTINSEETISAVRCAEWSVSKLSRDVLLDSHFYPLNA